MTRPACVALLLLLAAGLSGPPARAEGVHPELSLAASGVLNLGDFGTVSRFSVGGDAALRLGLGSGGFGLRTAGGVQLLQGHKIPTDEIIYNGIGTQKAIFEASQSFGWLAIGPAWSRPLRGGRADFYLMVGRANTKATSTVAWMNTTGADPGSNTVSLLVAGAAWSPRGSSIEVGTELFAGGSAPFWNDPPVVVDGAGNHELQGATVSITGVSIRVGYRFGGRTASESR